MPPSETAFAFFFKYRPTAFARGELGLEAGWVTFGLLLVVAAALTLTLLRYPKAGGRASRRERIALATLRIAILGLVILSLCQPVLVLHTVVPQQSFVALVLDDSASMQIADVDNAVRGDWVKETFGSGAPLIKQLQSRFKLRSFRAAGEAERLDDIGQLAFDGDETDLAAVLDRVRQELDQLPVAGVILVSDGADTAGGAFTEALLSLRSSGTAVSTVGVGRERFATDIEVGRVETPRSVLVGTALVSEVRLTQRGLSGERVQLLVEDEGRVVHTQDVELPPDDETASVRVHVTMNQPGPRRLRFRVTPGEGEQVEQNNAREVLVSVRDAQEDILYLEGEPRFELKFVRRAVAGDDNLRLAVLQRTAENKFLRLDIENAEELAGGFPTTREELFRYRGLVLGSVEASFFNRDQQRMIVDFVSQRGGGLLMLGGNRSFARGGYQGTPVAAMLPVVLEAGEDEFFGEVQVGVTPFGATHGVTQIENDPERTAARWAELPVVTTVNRITRVKPGAATLLVGTSPDMDEPQVVLAYGRYGRGKVLALTVQDTWQWQMHASMPLEDQTHEHLWQQLLRWLVSQVPGPVRAFAERDRVAPGDAIALRAEVGDDRYLRVNDARVIATVEDPEGRASEHTMEWSVARDGEYIARIPTEIQGIHRIRVEAFRGETPLGADETFVAVEALGDEFFGAEQRTALLRRVAEETGGRYYDRESLGGLVEDLGYSQGGASIREVRPLWDMPALYILVVLLLSVEWSLRKLRGLA